jgi:hypothetical protein
MMDVERTSLASSRGDRARRPPQEVKVLEDRTVFHLIDVPEVRTVSIRLMGNPYQDLEGGQGSGLRELLEDPRRAEAGCREWVEAGADILLAPTSRTTPSGLKPLGLAHRAMEITQAQLEALRRAAKGASPSPWVGAQVGPLGGGWGQRGFAGFDEAYIHFHEQAKGIALGHPDLVVVRGIRDLRMMRAALVALRELWSGQVMVLLDPEAYRPVLSLPPAGRERPLETAAEAIASLGIEGIGVEGRRSSKPSPGSCASRGSRSWAPSCPRGRGASRGSLPWRGRESAWRCSRGRGASRS